MLLTPDQSKKVGLGITPSPHPFLTPRPERRRMEPRVIDWNSNRQDRDKESNVQVLLRCRPLTADEQWSNVPKVISCNEQKREVTVLQSLANKQIDRVFTFDKVFGPKAQQRSIYDQAIAPIVTEVLEGFNCTVFAYGQTGTGKTYTMEGGLRNKGADLPAEAGVIPRAVRQIFDMLEAQNADYSVKVTFLELYNEEITDLLAPEENAKSTEDRQKKPISLMEDGKGCVVVRGLEEEAVYSVNEIYTLLEQGAAKRRTADTLLNKHSSRSHSIFTITVHVKEAAVGDEELIKCGKLNLVDLAGSENISRSGAREGRAREAGEINKSLLTLGRVINALVEHSSHIPYRDSKLTRLLRESLGGKTKTCIIATISPSAHSLEETLSTLDYAFRAKHIKNKPEANQKMSKAVLLKDLYLEIEKMKQDVRAAREKNGVYIPHERFAREEAEKKVKNEKIEQLENDLNLSEKQVDRFRELYLSEEEQKKDLESELKDCKINLEKSNKALIDLQESYRLAISTLKEKELIISKLLCSENSLIERAKELRTNLQSASEDIASLFTKLDQKEKMEAQNQSMVLTFGSQLDQCLKDLHRTILGSVSQQQQHLRCMEEHASSYLASKCDAIQALESKIWKMTNTYTLGVETLKELANTLQRKASSDLQQINSTISLQAMTVENLLATLVSEGREVNYNIQNSLEEQKQLLGSTARAELISKATMSFFNNLHNRASEVMRILEESQIERSHQLMEVEKTFKDEAAREEKQALEKIAAILESLTTKRTARVSEASRNIQHLSIQESMKLKQEMSQMQKVSTVAKKKLKEHVEKLGSRFLEDLFSTTEATTIMEDCLSECSKRVDYSGQQWENAQSAINSVNEIGIEEMGSTVMANIYSNHFAHEEFLCASSFLDADFDAKARDMLAAIKDSLMVDRQNKKKVDTMTTLCLDQLKMTQEKHGGSISNIRSQAEKCLVKDYLVDDHNSTTPKKRAVVVPSLASIEDMRTPAFAIDNENDTSENRLKWAPTESKIPRLAVSPILQRTPFVHLN
ncbi:hypothetical protein CJ030_MR2G007944 [Morella rubra]|uniref:Kinesin motor domain-containing protein n=1 Tax=Morella rubra TaxID=262757 RepID=A0A6A1WJY9_9ROSI|nr:hypothetical protein CJ030_MR2G007944 [Morella rubra]